MNAPADLTQSERVRAAVIAACTEAAQLAPGNTAAPSDKLEDDLKFDSLDLLEVILKIEEALGVEVPDPDVEFVDTVGDLIDVFLRLSGEAV